MNTNPVILEKTYMQKAFKFLVILAVLLRMGMPLLLYADVSPDLGVSPAVMDEKAKQRDIVNETIILTNTSNRVLTLYPSVKDINIVNGQQVFSYAKDSQDLAASLANWIELSRGVIELKPGEQKSVPFVIRVNMNALPNTYHAQIAFAEGSTRGEAEAKPNLAEAEVNVEVLSDAKELMQLNSFSSDNIVLSGDDVVFKYRVQNIGNQNLQPTGEIRIYDRKGEEVASIDVNKEGKSISPDNTSQLAAVWNGANGFGRFKALLTVNYGKGQTASVQDTVFFWIIPWKQLLALLVVSLIAIAFFAMHFHRWFEERHLNKLALAGVLNTDALAAKNAHFQAAAITAPERPSPKEQGPRPERRSIFHFFKRPRLPIPPVPTFKAFETKENESAKPERGSLRDALPLRKTELSHTVRISSVPQPIEDLGTIDLKNLQVRESQMQESEGHVINLKKRP